MSYKTVQIRLLFNKISNKILTFFEDIIYRTKRALHLVNNHERTNFAKYHFHRARKRIVSSSIENVWNWNNRLASSEGFRIEEDDV